MKDVFDYIDDEDLTPDLQIINDVCGIEAVKQMLRGMSGLTVYIPRPSHLETLMMKYVNDNTDKPLNQIARETQVSTSYLRQIQKKIRASKKAGKI